MKTLIKKIFKVDTLIMPSDVEFMKIDSDSVWATFEDLIAHLYIQDGLVYDEPGDRICTTMELEQFTEFAEITNVSRVAALVNTWLQITTKTHLFKTF